MDSHGCRLNANHNPNPYADLLGPDLDFQVSDYLLLQEEEEEDLSPQEMAFSPNASVMASGSGDSTSSVTNIWRSEHGEKKSKAAADHGAGSSSPPSSTMRVAFKTKSELEIMDDGFKWRKYGKKMVKNSPNPRNYYKCSAGGCNVKKRVERDREDPSYVITTYEGMHNHESPSTVYYNNTSVPFSLGYPPSTLQPSSSSSSHSYTSPS
ncbi:probable WRKY transcription factor 51 [Diospyros lotus]|uniref:probable WRKY transcription factor 51 n=1 Tax=Diospyros lotus TaxID=55363 RepID=UPI00225AA2D0|nr:probable WRKY transcription factor 51 [Diospyros lotus]